MEYGICLHLVDDDKQQELAKLVQQLLPPPAKEYLDERCVNVQDGWQCQVRCYFPVQEGCRIDYITGVMVVNDRLYNLNELRVTFTAAQAAAAKDFLQKLLAGPLPFVLEEGNLLLRVYQLLGRGTMSDMPLYDVGAVSTVLHCHLPWHICEVSKAWGDLLTKPMNRNLIRHLRVKLRRLRSCWSFFKRLFTRETFEKWQVLLRDWTTLLGYTREYDVALSTCRKIRQSYLAKDNTGTQSVSKLELLLEKLRQQQAAKLPELEQLNAITGHLVNMLIRVYLMPLEGEKRDLRLKPFLRERLAKWCNKLVSVGGRYPDLKNMEQLHKRRIRIKRLRYVLQGLPEINTPNALVRSMKSMQDLLGLLHDDYVNALLIEQILQQHQEDAELRYQCAMFCGWERAKTEEAMTNLPVLWDNFITQLTSWQKENL